MFKKTQKLFLSKKINLFFILFWLLSIVGWFFAFPMNTPFDIGDLITEGTYLLIAFVGFVFVYKFPIISVGWSIFLTGLLVDFLDEFTNEPNLLSTYIEGFLTALGLLMVALGLYKIIQDFKKSEKNLDIMLNSASAMIWYKDTENNFIEVNKKVAEFSGLTQEDINGRSASDVYPEEADEYYEDDKEVIRTKESKRGIEEILRSQSGEKIWVRTDKMPIIQDGEVEGVLVFSVDITQDKKRRKKLERMNDAMIGRELKMVELKKEINRLQELLKNNKK